MDDTNNYSDPLEEGTSSSQTYGSDEDRPSISSDQLTEFVTYIVQNIVTNREAVEIAVMEDVPGSYTVHIKVAQEDKGRVIGKKGNTINAIRALVRVFGRIIVLIQE